MSFNDVLAFGKVGLFCGIETFSYQPGDWSNLAGWCAQHRVDFVLVKVFDAGNEWYGGNFLPIATTFQRAGVRVIPYGFMGTAGGLDYNLDRDLPNELPLVRKYMENFSICCGDMEGDGWSNRPDLGQMVANELAGIPGFFVGSVPANPADAGMVNSFAAMKSVVSAWMPMEYNDYLHSVSQSQWSQVESNPPLAPTYDLSNEFGANDLVSIVTGASSAGFQQISFWYDGFAKNDPTTFDNLVTIFKGVDPVTINPNMQKQWNDTWALGGLPTGTGIEQALFQLFLNRKCQAVFPTHGEYLTVNWNGEQIARQPMSNGFAAEYNVATHIVTVFDASNSLVS